MRITLILAHTLLCLYACQVKAAETDPNQTIDNNVIAAVKEFEEKNPPQPKPSGISFPFAFNQRPKTMEEIRKELRDMARRSLSLGREALELLHSNVNDPRTLQLQVNYLRARQKGSAGGALSNLSAVWDSHNTNMQKVQDSVQSKVSSTPVLGPTIKGFSGITIPILTQKQKLLNRGREVPQATAPRSEVPATPPQTSGGSNV